jgi:hypothetical protein
VSRVECAREFGFVDILCRVANGAEVSSPISARLTDHIAIGVLSGLIHRDIVDDVINKCGKREKRSRLLPAHVVVYYVLALNLFFGEAYEEVMRQLVNGLRFLGNWRQDWTVPSASALSQARTRLGEAPLRLLFEQIAVPMARAGTRGAWFRGLRIMALDGVAAASAGADLEPTQATLIRVVEYMIEDRPGSGELFCLITTITDHELAPALDLAAAYHQRWEIELSFDEIQTHQTGHHRVLRSRTPELVKQEIWALLLTHYAIRHVMKDAADTVGTDPDDLSFIRSYRAIRRQVTNQAGFSP